MENIVQLQKRLWEAADEMRANSKLTSTEYYMPILGLIFLRHAFNRFLKVEQNVKQTLPSRGGVVRPLTKDDFVRQGALFLQEQARYDYLLNLPQDQGKGQAVVKAMELIEADYEALKGVLPKEYQIFEDDVLTRLLKIFNDEALNEANGDVFGRIYEYFLMNFAIEGAQDKGEFFTPVALVQTIVNVIEPDHGTVLDPACGSGGMFVQTSHFLQDSGKKTQELVTFYGQEKTETTIRLAKMNLAVHGLEGKIELGNTFYEDRHELMGKADFVMANPPFNVDKVEAEKVKTDPRLPFGLPGVNKAGEVSNGNYLWISYFYSYLKPGGRSGFVMSAQASSAGNQEKEVRRKIVETGHVDVMVAIRPNFFYTRTVPCELWFFDKGKPADRQDQVLMIDARGYYRKVTRTIYDFSPEQLKNLMAIVWLYRGQKPRFLGLVDEYLQEVRSQARQVAGELEPFETSLEEFAGKLRSFGEVIATVPELDAAAVTDYLETGRELVESMAVYRQDRDELLRETGRWQVEYSVIPLENAAQQQAATAFQPLVHQAKGLTKQVEAVAKLTARLAEMAKKTLGATKLDAWDNRTMARLEKELNEARHLAVEPLKQVGYFTRQVHWLQSRFPAATLVDVPGLVKLADRQEIEQNDWSLTPGRYVGVAPQEVGEDFDFEQTMREIHVELAGLNLDADELAAKIQANFEDLGI